MFISNAYAEPSTLEALGLGSGLSSFLPILLMFVVLYFMMIRPQMKRQKEHRAMMEAVGKGDEIITAGGILGQVTKVGEVYVTLQIAPGAEILVQKSSMITLLPKGTIKTL